MENELWAIKSPEGVIQYATITFDEDDSWAEMSSIREDVRGDSPSDADLYSEGYRAVRVVVQEIDSSESEGGE